MRARGCRPAGSVIPLKPRRKLHEVDLVTGLRMIGHGLRSNRLVKCPAWQILARRRGETDRVVVRKQAEFFRWPDRHRLVRIQVTG